MSTSPFTDASPQNSESSISVIIPVYNRPRMAVEAVQSVLFQSHTRLECILVDDGSTEPPEEACRLFGADPRFRYLRTEHTGMPGAARNRGVAASRFDLIAFLDSDDLWFPRKLEFQLGLMKGSLEPGGEKGPALIHSREVWLRGDRTISQKTQRHRRRGNVFRDALVKCMIGPSTVLMDRKVYRDLGGFREDLEVAEDYEFWLRLTARYDVEYIDVPLVVKRAGHGEQLSEKYGQIEIFRLRVLYDLLRSGWFFEIDSLRTAQKIRRSGRGSTGLTEPDSSPAWESFRDSRDPDWPAAQNLSSPEVPEDPGGPSLHEIAAAELVRKAGIYAAGCRKRGRDDEALMYERMAGEFLSSRGLS